MKQNILTRNICFFSRTILLIFIPILFIVSSCKKLVEIDAPGNSLNAGNVYSNDATAIAVLTGVYTKISNFQYDLTSHSATSISLYAGLSADEITLFNLSNASLVDFYRNNLTSNSGNDFLWNATYDHIFTVNASIEGLTASGSLTPLVKEHLLGEAKFLRAFCYFYLTNLYGNVPLVLTTNWGNNASTFSSSQVDIYKQIIKDLKEAKSLLNENFLGSDLLSPTQERIRPNKWAASALLSRTYLYTKDWLNAENEATLIINKSVIYDTVTLNNVFKKNSMETIWALQSVRTGTSANTGEGFIYILPNTGPNTNDYPVYLSNNIVNSFEPGDLRKVNWVDSVKPVSTAYYYAKKYKIGKVNTSTQEYNIILRVAELYLIRAEARAMQNNLTGAIADLDVIRKRAGLPLIANTNPGINQSVLIDTILHERQIELFSEWGHRWLDLKRTNTVDAVMTTVSSQKGGTWAPYKGLFPIPYSEIKLNPNINQNSGY